MKWIVTLAALALLALSTGSAQESSAPPLAGLDTGAGETVFTTNCAACHQQNGQGVPGAFPPLAAHAPVLATAEGGRDYLANVLLYGLMGQIEVAGQTYNGVMPPWQQLSDQQLADVLNYVLSAWDNAAMLPEDFAAFSAADVTAQRETQLSSQQVYEQRQRLELDGE